METLWTETVKKWTEQGHVKEGEDLSEHFNMDIRSGGWLNSVADLDFEPVTIEEDEETILQLNGNGATLRWCKTHASTPEHVDFKVKDSATWNEHVRHFLAGPLDKRRIPFEGYRKARAFAKEKERFFCWGGVAPFEQMHPTCGHENAYRHGAGPEWVQDMANVYATLAISALKNFAAEGGPTACFFMRTWDSSRSPL